MAKVAFTAKRIADFTCPADKQQAFLWDTTAPGLGLRATPTGKPAFIFQSRYQGKSVRITIGSPTAWDIPTAQAKARELQRLIDEGSDPRESKRQQLAKAKAAKAKRESEAVTFAEAWQAYTKARAPHWGEHHRKDHEKQVRPPGTTKAGKPAIAGPLFCFMNKRLAELTPEAIERWAAREGKARPTTARLGWRLLKAFLAWCGTQNQYRALVQDNPADSKKARESLGTPKAKQDAIRKGQIAAFFQAAQGVSSPTISAYLQAMLLTGARPGELLALKWADINEQWGSITLRDKDESKGGKDGTRDIPLTPYVRHLLASLPRRSEWVFSSATLNQPINPPRQRMGDVARISGIDGLSLHGLRRSFGSLSEWLEIPAGVIAQIQGHKPSATAEKHYRVRELDLLAVHHARFEAWILEQAGIAFDRNQQHGGLRVVAGREA
ncbi:tyrosine-type recombinase/integrase [Halopseudomonas yangmingensis]|uniref:Site-specific recombinase XerD n=1 Tax=Halopseudomonas yangmingensis TaxID=1720063 RepID=A0A1I4SLA7_9GAMM|nr:integrase family protein [Halopseudomonas yangmingensis]SFM65171.1 Site-specific recombinase XerD [Halopseudomonas yangmingensis]